MMMCLLSSLSPSRRLTVSGAPALASRPKQPDKWFPMRLSWAGTDLWLSSVVFGRLLDACGLLSTLFFTRLKSPREKTYRKKEGPTLFMLKNTIFHSCTCSFLEWTSFLSFWQHFVWFFSKKIATYSVSMSDPPASWGEKKRKIKKNARKWRAVVVDLWAYSFLLRDH